LCNSDTPADTTATGDYSKKFENILGLFENVGGSVYINTSPASSASTVPDKCI